jgi:hypothetical protein
MEKINGVMECWSIDVRVNASLHYSTILLLQSLGRDECPIESRLAAIRSIFVDDSALGSFIDS